MNVITGQTSGAGNRYAIVVSRFNELVTDRLLAGATSWLQRHEVAADDIDVAWVPGAVEIPIVAKRCAASGKYSAVIAVGAVVRGDTSHYDVVCNMVAAGVAEASQATGVPVIFGVLTTDTMEQALDRAGGKAGNKGAEAAAAAIEMGNLLARLGE